LVEGNHEGQISTIATTVSIEPVLDEFPGIVLIQPNPADPAGVLALRGRQILGSKGNIYYPPHTSANPSLTESSAPGDATRPNYLNAIYSSTAQDGASGDTVGGKLFACKLSPQMPASLKGINLGVITTSQKLMGLGGSVPTIYQIAAINLNNTEVLTVDTTGGPVYINMYSLGSLRGITLRDNAQILNIRTDGTPPRVGDLRIMSRQNSLVTLSEQTCIQNAFLWFYIDELRLLTSGPGCPSGKNTNVEGVVWMEAILSAKQVKSNRSVNYLGFTKQSYDTTAQAGVTSGIAVPDDVSSLVDLLDSVDWPVRYKYGVIKNWQRVN
jgi:hypothetical protein